jgi:8-oxo-dGTP diphosphatase
MAIVRSRGHAATAGSDARHAQWHPVRALGESGPRLAFDHAEILATAQERLQGKVRYAPLGFSLLPERFTLPDLQAVYEAVLQRSLDRGNFRSAILSLGVLRKVGKQRGAPGKPPDLYRFDKRAYERTAKGGWYFDPVPRAPKTRNPAEETPCNRKARPLSSPSTRSPTPTATRRRTGRNTRLT